MSESNIEISILVLLITICLSSLVMSVITFIKKDNNFNGNKVDPNALQIDHYLESEHGKEFMSNYINSFVNNLDNFIRPHHPFKLNTVEGNDIKVLTNNNNVISEISNISSLNWKPNTPNISVWTSGGNDQFNFV